MNSLSDIAYIAFEQDRCIATGDLHQVARAAKRLLDRRKEASILAFDGRTSAPIDIDFRGSLGGVPARLPEPPAPPAASDDDALPAARGPGRPKLGVVAREITLLPRHWEWLAQQSGGASGALRRLVEEGTKRNTK